MAAATASASEVSSGWPLANVLSRRLKTSFGRRLRCSATLKTLDPKISDPGWVRSVVPRALPLVVHCAARTFGWRVRAMGMARNLIRARIYVFVQVDQQSTSIFRHLAKAARRRPPDTARHAR